jgi:hypothetical protein
VCASANVCYSKELTRACNRWHQKFKNRKAYGIKNNAITKFAEAYVIDMGMNPFQKKGGAATKAE